MSEKVITVKATKGSFSIFPLNFLYIMDSMLRLHQLLTRTHTEQEMYR